MVLEGTISPISVGGLQKRNTNANRIIMSPRFGSLNEWRQTETAVVEGGYTLNEPNRYYIATVRSPERKEASGIGDDKTEGTHQTHPKAQYHHGSSAGTKRGRRKRRW